MPTVPNEIGNCKVAIDYDGAVVEALNKIRPFKGTHPDQADDKDFDFVAACYRGLASNLRPVDVGRLAGDIQADRRLFLDAHQRATRQDAGLLPADEIDWLVQCAGFLFDALRPWEVDNLRRIAQDKPALYCGAAYYGLLHDHLYLKYRLRLDKEASILGFDLAKQRRVAPCE